MTFEPGTVVAYHGSRVAIAQDSKFVADPCTCEGRAGNCTDVARAHGQSDPGTSAVHTGRYVLRLFDQPDAEAHWHVREQSISAATFPVGKTVLRMVRDEVAPTSRNPFDAAAARLADVLAGTS